MNTSHGTAEEMRIAQEIMSVLPEGSVARVCSNDDETVRYTVSNGLLKLRSVVLCRESLRRLQADPDRAVKIEYLQRDLLSSAIRRAEFRYPRVSRIFRKRSLTARIRAASLAVAALGR
jgi:hypothetical protein